VAWALDRCVESWLRPVVRIAFAPVIVLFGDRARTTFHDTYGIPLGTPLTGPRNIEGADRLVLQLPHPNQHGDLKRNCAPLTPEQLDQVRRYIRSRWR
jgi:hypothetical protein